MPSAAALRIQIETALVDRIPSALTPGARLLRPVISTGIDDVDALLAGGFPLGAITEITGPECSGRTALALSFLAQITAEAKVCAWIDASDALHPESVAAAGVDLTRLLWVRCGVSNATRRHEPIPFKTAPPSAMLEKPGTMRGKPKPLSRIEQALRVADLLLQAGGFSAIVLDLGSIAAEHASRVPLATWFRYRAAAERTQASILLLTQHPCATSSAGLVVRMHPGAPLDDEATVFAGVEHRIEIGRERFAPAPVKVVPLRKPPQRERCASWQSRTVWAGRR